MCQADMYLGESIEESHLCCGKEAKNLTLSSGVIKQGWKRELTSSFFFFLSPKYSDALSNDC